LFITKNQKGQLEGELAQKGRPKRSATYSGDLRRGVVESPRDPPELESGKIEKKPRVPVLKGTNSQIIGNKGSTRGWRGAVSTRLGEKGVEAQKLVCRQSMARRWAFSLGG